LSKPHAVEHLATDIGPNGYDSDIAVIVETHFKSKHMDGSVGITGYNIFRHDRARRKGGGVAVYMRTSLHATVWRLTNDDDTFELLWIRTGEVFVGALYHPPKPIYKYEALLNHLEQSLEQIERQFPAATIVLCGDFNQLKDSVICERTGLLSVVKQSTRGDRILDRIYVSSPTYNTVRSVTSVLRSDHKAVVAYADQSQCPQVKTSTKLVYRRRTPSQHAAFLQCAADLDFGLARVDVGSDAQSQFDQFYTVACQLLDAFYPECSITVTSHDPSYMTGYVKAMLHKKTCLLRKGRVEEASALARRIGNEITRRTKTQLSLLHENVDSGHVSAILPANSIMSAVSMALLQNH